MFESKSQNKSEFFVKSQHRMFLFFFFFNSKYPKNPKYPKKNLIVRIEYKLHVVYCSF